MTSHPSATASPLARLLLVIDGLCAAIAARGAGGALTTPLLFLLWRRLRRIATRAQQAAARIASGAPLPAPRSPSPTASPRPPRPPPLRLPRGFAWLVGQVPATAGYASQLQYLLADPDIAPLLAAPSLRRMLNPLCRMLGIPKPPPQPPPSSRPAAAAPRPPIGHHTNGPCAAGSDPPPSAKPLAA